MTFNDRAGWPQCSGTGLAIKRLGHGETAVGGSLVLVHRSSRGQVMRRRVRYSYLAHCLITGVEYAGFTIDLGPSVANLLSKNHD